MADMNWEPRRVARVETKWRRIVTPIPAPESLPILEKLRAAEPRSMTGQPPILWDRAEGAQVFDRWGNVWLDFSSGVVATNAGHSRKEIGDAIKRQVDAGLFFNYCFPSEIRAKLAGRLTSLAPAPLKKAFLLSTGSEAVEVVLKIARTWGPKVGGPKKIGVVSFEGAFHGRTLHAQSIGGIPELKSWIPNPDPTLVQVPFPDGFRNRDVSFATFEKAVAAKGLTPETTAAVILETFQGGGVQLAPVPFMQELRAWCDRNKIVLILDEIQAAFGRTGRLWGFEHYGIVPDLLTLGKGISSSLPLAAVLGREDIMDLYAPGSMTSTHTGNPVCVAAGLANVDLIVNEKLPEKAAKTGEVLLAGLRELGRKHAKRIGHVAGVGLVAGVHVTQGGAGATDPDPGWAGDVVRRSIEKGLLFFAPVGKGGGTIKFAPPLIITEEQVKEGLLALGEAMAEAG